jgi:hypothetical protein
MREQGGFSVEQLNRYACPPAVGSTHPPHRIHVVSTPVPPVRLLRSIEARLKGLYDALLDEPVPQPMLDLIEHHERHSRLC